MQTTGNEPLRVEAGRFLRIIDATSAKQTDDCQWSGYCPAHTDRSPSLSINSTDDGKVLMHCHAGCSIESVLSALGMSLKDLMPEMSESPSEKKEIVATYDYVDELGELQFQVVRYDPKDFRQRRPDGEGGWIWNRKGVNDVLYRLPEINSNPKKIVVIVEGEKDADNAAKKLGITTTTNAGGAEKFKKRHAEMLRGRRVVLVPDNDAAGTTHINAAAELLTGIAESVSIAVLPVGPKEDISDWIEAGGTKEQFKELITPYESSGKKKTEVIESVTDPHRLARVNLDNYWNKNNRKLIYWNQMWLKWKDGCYHEIRLDHLTARVTASVKDEYDRAWEIAFKEYEDWKNSEEYDEDKDKGPPVVLKVTIPQVRNVTEAMRSMVTISCDTKLNSWLDGRESGTLISMKNGILDITELLTNKNASESDVLISHSKDWFTMSQLNFDFNMKSDCPSWKAFMIDVFNNDIEAINTLRDWFGYLLAEDNSLNKIMMIIGQKRSGKGTILSVLKGLVGEKNIATPTLTELGTQFGIQPLIGKTSAIITDARMGDRADHSSITERLLSISGNDPQNVQRKFKETLTGFQIKTRFTLFSNMLPMLKDVSSAFLSRCIFLVMPNSYLGREDFGLQKRLLSELSGIFNWAVVGLSNLRQIQRIEQPESGRKALDELNSIISPVLQFTEERLECGIEYWCDVHSTFDAWAHWCRDNDLVYPGNIQTFSRKLRAVMPTISTNQYRPKGGTTDQRRRRFVGIKLKPKEDLLLECSDEYPKLVE